MSANTNTLGQLQKRTGPSAGEGKRDGGEVKAKVDVDAIMAMIDRLEEEIQVGNGSVFVQISLVHSHCSRNVEDLKVLKYFHGVATPVLQCHKEFLSSSDVSSTWTGPVSLKYLHWFPDRISTVRSTGRTRTCTN